jgi:hypothetical protein
MIMRTILATLAITCAVVLIGGAVFVYSGFYDIGATSPHWGITHWVMEKVRVRSIKAHAAGSRRRLASMVRPGSRWAPSISRRNAPSATARRACPRAMPGIHRQPRIHTNS